LYQKIYCIKTIKFIYESSFWVCKFLIKDWNGSNTHWICSLWVDLSKEKQLCRNFLLCELVKFCCIAWMNLNFVVHFLWNLRNYLILKPSQLMQSSWATSNWTICIQHRLHFFRPVKKWHSSFNTKFMSEEATSWDKCNFSFHYCCGFLQINRIISQSDKFQVFNANPKWNSIRKHVICIYFYAVPSWKYSCNEEIREPLNWIVNMNFIWVRSIR
jgi:hypothetical protein